MYKCVQGHFTDKEHDGKNCPYDNMSASELSSALVIDTEQKAREKYQSAMRGKGIVYLDNESYAKLCSAVKTKYCNKIPKRGKIYVGESLFCFKYSKRKEQILCTFELKIVGNEELIRTMTED